MQRVSTVFSILVRSCKRSTSHCVAGKKCYKKYSQELLQNKMFFFPLCKCNCLLSLISGNRAPRLKKVLTATMLTIPMVAKVVFYLIFLIIVMAWCTPNNYICRKPLSTAFKRLGPRANLRNQSLFQNLGNMSSFYRI